MLNSVYRANTKTEERVYLICCNSKMKVLGTFLLSIGSVNMSIVDIKSVMQKALLCNATNIVLAHNHPSGDCSPSMADIKVTQRLNEASKMMDVNFCDHIIIGNGYYSFQENGKMASA